MFATTFPDLRWLKEQAENRFFRANASGAAGSGWPTVILNVRASSIHRDNIPGPLSLFSNWTGVTRVTVDGRSFDIPKECFVQATSFNVTRSRLMMMSKRKCSIYILLKSGHARPLRV
jgi:hypothetical protein